MISFIKILESQSIFILEICLATYFSPYTGVKRTLQIDGINQNKMTEIMLSLLVPVFWLTPYISKYLRELYFKIFVGTIFQSICVNYISKYLCELYFKIFRSHGALYKSRPWWVQCGWLPLCPFCPGSGCLQGSGL